MRSLIFLTALWLAGPLQAAEYLGSFHWTYPKPYFGGWSGIDVSEDGNRFIAIADSGQIIDGAFLRENGRIVGTEFPHVRRIKTHRGKPVGPLYEVDSEGLAVAEDGTIYVSFERWVRLRSYADWAATAKIVPRHSDFKDMRHNGALEALAISSDGTLYTVPERSSAWREDHKVYRLIGRTWEIFDTLPYQDYFKPVGADFGPDGLFYLLERRWLPILGFKTRVRRFEVGPNGLENEETLFQTGFRTHDNLEGIAVWLDTEGALRLTMVSDNNFSRFQRTEIVEYSVPDRVDP